MSALQAPFPYFGGKSRIASEVWARFGDVGRYVEPFAGSLAVLLARPTPFKGREIVNDADGLLVNMWRAMAQDPEAVADWCDWPATESDLHARHAWLVGQRESLTKKLEGDPDYFDAKAAGWWLWGIGLWIGGGWCSGDGPWSVVDGELVHARREGENINRKRPHASSDGQGIHRQLLNVGASLNVAKPKPSVAAPRGVHRKIARPLGGGIHRGALALSRDAQGVHAASRADDLLASFQPLADRIRDVMVMAGDWGRVVTPAVLGLSGATDVCAVYLDPPYADTADRTADVYAKDDLSVAHDVREWAIANGHDRRLRIALSGYEGEHNMPSDWVELAWSANGGYAQGDTRDNRHRERVWFSPTCLKAGLWDDAW